MRRAERVALRAVRGAARREHERHGRTVARGRVLNTSPLIVDLLESDLQLEADDLDLSHIDADLAVGDVLALLEVGVGDWIVVSVALTGAP